MKSREKNEHGYVRNEKIIMILLIEIHIMQNVSLSMFPVKIKLWNVPSVFRQY